MAAPSATPVDTIKTINRPLLTQPSSLRALLRNT